MMTAASAATMEEKDLIHSARRGDTRACGELMDRHREGVVRVVYRMCGDPDLAEDAAQEAFIRAWQRLDSYQPQRPFRAWIYRIAINAALDALRGEKPARALEVIENTPGPNRPGADPEGDIERRQRAEQVQHAVMRLPDASRAVLVLREWGGLSYNEIAESLSIPLGTVMSRLNTARAQLRQQLAAYLEVL
jgi:RNA polymerase sigma-70 factor (ECF subfamily)